MKTKILSLLAISALMFTACGSDNETDAPEVNDGRVKFSSGVTPSKQRIIGDDGNQWENTDHIGIYMVDKGTINVAENADNIDYKAILNTPATSASFRSTLPIFYPVDATKKVEFIAYYPFTVGINNYEYSVDTKNQNEQSAIDLMRATANNGGEGYDKTSGGSVNLAFDHKLTKLVFNTRPDTNAGLTEADLANMTLTIYGLNTEALYNIDTDALSTPIMVAPVATKNTIVGKKYEAIVVPQSFLSNIVRVEFALNNSKNEVFIFNIPSSTFASGEKHSFNVSIQRTGVVVRGTINPWQPMGAVDGTAQ